jgi:hypothetical protein
MSVQWGNLAEWFSGLGALAAAGTALFISRRAERLAIESAREARQAASRERVSALLVELVKAVEGDIRQAEQVSNSLGGYSRSIEAQALCRALWGHRNLFGTTWHVYCEVDQEWPRQLADSGDLYPRMRTELQTALDSLDYEDRR